MLIRKATKDDLNNIFDVSSAAHHAYTHMIPPHRREELRRLYSPNSQFIHTFRKRWLKLMSEGAELYIAEEDSNARGYVGIIRKNRNLVTLEAIFVHPDFQDTGIGTILMQHVINKMKKGELLEAVVVKNNLHAIRFYERFKLFPSGVSPKKFMDAEQIIVKGMPKG